MTRRGENIRKRKDGRWEARYKKGRKPDGSILYGYVYAHTYSEAKQKRDAAIISWNERNHTVIHTSSPITFGDLFDEWMHLIRHTVKESSYCLYMTIMEKHLCPYFGNVKLSDFTQDQIHQFIFYKASEGFSPSYIYSMMAIVKSVLKFAKEKKYLPETILSYQLPKKRNSHEIFTGHEWMILENHLKNQSDDFSFGVLLCMYTGIRIGELSGLKWEDFDFINNQFLIRRTVYRIKNLSNDSSSLTTKTILCIRSPKTESSLRSIPFPHPLISLIPYHVKAEDTFILTGTTKCMEPRNIQRKYRKILEKCGLRYLNFHSLRHNFATIAIQKGFDYKTLSDILGHSSASVTLNTYAHTSIEQKRRNMDLFFA